MRSKVKRWRIRCVETYHALDDRAFGEAGIFESCAHDARFAVQQQHSSHPARSTLGQRQFFSFRQSLHAIDQRFFGSDFDVGRYGRRKSHAHEVEGEEMADQRDRNVTRSVGMSADCQPDLAASIHTGGLADALDFFTRKC
ncbi:MAG: hypothetical protein DMG90_15680 [Acidobacteria bacterium]|nr:MAG: hypothetical protein DMG90_15680 [Acidobacteriota bacterium]